MQNLQYLFQAGNVGKQQVKACVDHKFRGEMHFFQQIKGTLMISYIAFDMGIAVYDDGNFFFHAQLQHGPVAVCGAGTADAAGMEELFTSRSL